MLDLLLSIVLLLGVVQKHLDRDYFISWVEESIKIIKGRTAYYVVQVIEIIVGLYSLIAKQSLEKLCLCLLFISLVVITQLIIKRKIPKSCPCFGNISFGKLTSPLIIYTALFCVGVFNIVMFGSGLGATYTTVRRVLDTTFIVSLLLAAFNAKNRERRILARYEKLDAGGYLELPSFAEEDAAGEHLILFISTGCNLCKAAATIISRLQSLWQGKVYCAIEGYSPPEGAGQTSLEGMSILYCEEKNYSTMFNIKSTPALVHIRNNDVLTYTGLYDVISGFADACLRKGYFNR